MEFGTVRTPFDEMERAAVVEVAIVEGEAVAR
jgi:hypothetical protein